MATPNFFANVEVLNHVLHMDLPDTGRDIDLTLDIIDLPLWLSLHSDEKTQTLLAYNQTELYNKDEKLSTEKGSLVLDRASGEAQVKASQDIAKNMGAFFFACRNMSRLIQSEHLESLYDGLDPANAGILLTLQDGTLRWNVVSGRERPSLSLQTLFGEVTTGRPYMDDFWERSELEDADLDEKIAAAEDGNLTAMENLAMLYLNGDDEKKIAPDPEKSAYWFRKVAATGDANAMFNLGLYYAKGHGVTRDFKQAAEWMEKAAAAGDNDAAVLVKEYQTLAEASEKAQSGDAQAQADLAAGLMKLGGSLAQADVKDDYAESVKWASSAASQGNADAMWILALAYEHGRGVAENKATAIEYYKKGAQLGNAACQHNLGCCYARGDHLEKDSKKAFALFQQAADQGYGLAMKDLGRCYQFGTGCTGNMKTALMWYEKASQVLNDPELDQRVAVLKGLADAGPNWGEDYEGAPEDDSSLPEGYMDALSQANESEEDAPPEASPACDEEPLRFDLKPGYEVEEDVNDKGDRFFQIRFGVTVGDNGQKQAEFSCKVTERDDLEISDDVINVKGNFRAAARSTVKQMQVLFTTMTMVIAVVVVEHKGKHYALSCSKLFREAIVESEVELMAQRISEVLNSMVIGGDAAHMEPIPASLLLESEDSADKNPDAFPLATPSPGQHSQYDFIHGMRNAFGALGGIVQINQNGTECAFKALTDCGDNSSEGLFERIAGLDQEGFALSETAHSMARLFRVSQEVFDPGHDREQEIENGYIQKTSIYNALRSFAWTVCAYCGQKNLQPGEVDYDTLAAIVRFIEGRNWLNYTDKDHCTTLCSGDDIHVYYVPDALDAAGRKALLHEENVDSGEKNVCTIQSLDGLRKDLACIFPAIKTIYRQLASQRDPDEALEGGTADILYAWCSMTYAARTPIFVEDGPVNCMFEHPDAPDPWQEPLTKQNVGSWMQEYSRYLSRDGKIQIPGKKFVFTGIEFRRDWDAVLQKFTEQGGILRTAVSGQTDYLVCDPDFAGSSKVNAAIQQQEKGKGVKIVLAEDFLKALGYEDPKQAPAAEVRLPEPETPETPEPAPSADGLLTLSYRDGLTAEGNNIVMDIPDGFRIKTGVEGRDFIAYLPNAENLEDHHSSSCLIMAGTMTKSDVAEQFRTVQEYEALARSTIARMETHTASMFERVDYLAYSRADLPGGIALAYDKDVIHANLYAGVSGGLQLMRLQISGVERKDRAAWNSVILEIFNHLRAKNPAPMAEDPDSEKYTQAAFTQDLAAQWSSCIQEHISHLTVSRAIMQNFAVESFKEKSAKGDGNLPQLKKKLRQILSDTRDNAEALLRRCAAVYQNVKDTDPENPALPDMRDALDPLIAFADQTLSLNEEEMKVPSEYAKALKARLDPSRADLAAQREREAAEAQRKAREEAKRRNAEQKRKQDAESRRLQEEKRREEEEKRKIEEARRQEEAEKRRLELARLEAERRQREAEERAAAERAAALRAEQKRQKRAAFRKKLVKALKISAVILVLLAILVALTPTVILPAIRRALDYKSARELLEQGSYDSAKTAFLELGDYKDAAELAKESVYRKAENLLENREFPDAIALWEELGPYSDSADRAEQTLVQWRDPDYQTALKLMEQGEYLPASNLFSSLGGYRDSDERSQECLNLKAEEDYQAACAAFSEGDYEGAMAAYQALGSYKNSEELYARSAYTYGCALLDAGKYSSAVDYLKKAGGYVDSNDKINEATYLYAKQLLSEKSYLAAIGQYQKCRNYQDSAAKILEAKFAYAKEHLDRGDENTTKFLDELVSAEYSGAKKLLDELYAWKVEILGFNNTPYNTTGQKTISKYSAMYAHFKVTGGKPGESVMVKAVLKAPNGQSGTIPFYGCTDGKTMYVNFWYDNPYYGANGTMTLSVYSESGELLARDSVSVVG